MTLKMRAQQHEPPEAGIYRARLVDIQEGEGQFGPFVKWIFEEWIYRQEYCCEFVETEGQLFTYDVMHSAVSQDVQPLHFGEDTW